MPFVPPHESQRGSRVSKAVFTAAFAPTGSGWSRAVLLGALFVAGVALSLARTPRSQWNVLWAEDGAVFLSDALNRPALALVSPYSGYLHLVPRAAAFAVSWLPLEIIPAAITVAAATITSLLGLFCFVMLESRIAAVPLRLAVWVTCVAAPTMGGDVANNLANLHWYLLVSAICALLTSARSRATMIAQVIVVFSAVASDALGLFLLPLFVLRFWVLTERRDRYVVLAAAAGGMLQAAAVVGGLISVTREMGQVHPSALDVVQMYSVRVVLAGSVGVTGAQAAWSAVGIAAGLTALVFAVAVMVISFRLDRRRRWGIALFAVSSVGASAMIWYFQWYAVARSGVGEVFTGMRYAVVPTALLMISLLIALDALIERIRSRSVRRFLCVVALGLVVLPVAVDLRASTPRSDHAVWRDTLIAGRAWCAEGRSPDDMAKLGTSPSFFGGMLLRCDVLESR